MPDTQLSQLLDRAVHEAPPMHLDGATMLAAGRGRVRRRRAVGVGGVLGAVALAGALWFAPGGPGTPTGLEEIRPATTVWEQGETVEGTLFTGLQTVDQEQVGHTYAAQLSRTSGEGPVTLVLSDGGDAVEEVRSSTPVPGLDVFAGERMTVAVWREPEGVRASVPLVGPVDPGGPANVQRAEVDGEQLAYAVWSADVVPLPEEVVDVYLVGRNGSVALSGTPVRWSRSTTAGHRLDAFADERRGVVGYLVDDEEPVLTQLGDRPARVFSSGALSPDGTETRVLLLPEGSEVEGAPDEDERGVGWIATELLERPLALVVREDAGDRPPSDLEFTLAGDSYSFSDYVQDLNMLDVDGAALVARSGEAGEVTLWGRDADEPEATFEGGTAWGVLAVQPVGGSLVTLAEGWDAGATVLADARVEVTQDGAPRWVVPTDVAQVVLDDGRLVTLLAVDAEDGLDVTAVGLERAGEVERWDPPPGEALGAGVELPVVDGTVVPTVDGQEMARVGGTELGDARLYRRPADAPGDDLLVLPAGLDRGDVVVPVLRKGDGLDVAPWVLGASTTVSTDAGGVRVVAVPTGMLDEDSRLAVRSAAAIDAGSVDTWTLMGAPGGHLVVDPGLVVSVAGDGWLLHEEGDTSDGTGLRAGLVGLTLAELPRHDDPSRYDLVAVLPAGSDPELLLGEGAELHGSTAYDGPVGGTEVWTADVTIPEGVSPADAVRGLDLDDDGQPDLRLPFRG